MNTRIYERAISIAKALKPKVQNGKSAHSTFVIRQSKIVCIAVNDYTKPHNEKRFGKYGNWKGFLTAYKPSTHSECAAISKLGEEELGDYEFLNIRIDNNGNANMARPCPNCYTVLRSFGGGPKKMFYSDSEGNLIQDERF
jgi:hypothetical protein